ncbi:MAG TPA: crossover junction endodeoxyribonuclease RuvC [Syntrophobacteria bacterium]|nr:crossover junction endodeoxyribonuclease RuvC [Syntrophobacteria bacterium]
MRIIGIDPGSLITGYGIVEPIDGRPCHVASGRVMAPAGVPFNGRLRTIYSRLAEVITHHRPEVMAVEDLFFARNVKTALKLGHVRGVAMLAGLNAGLPIAEYSPLTVKQALVGYGRAQKEQIQEMVRLLLRLEFLPEPDTADALAVAVCHLHSSQGEGRLCGRLRR